MGMISINLIPQSVRMAQMRRRHIRGWSMAVLGAMVLLAVPVVIAWVRHADAADLESQSQALQANRAAARKQLSALVATTTETVTQVDRARALRSKRAWSSMIALVGERLTEGCWLTSLATDPKQPAAGPSRKPVRRAPKGGEETPSSITIEAPRKLRIMGFATESAEPHQFVTNLRASGIFSEVTLERSRRQAVLGGSYFHFEVLCEW